MHQQEVVTVVFQAEVVGDTCGHRYGTHTGITDQRIDLLVAGQEDVHQLHEAYTTHGSHDEGAGADCEDEDGVHGQEL